ncbi:MAG TPA: hypothetical protein ENL13_04585 [Thermoplasmatales archaeon]|nr:hypothetical protein [Thermoplasmatales archaeon]
MEKKRTLSYLTIIMLVLSMLMVSSPVSLHFIQIAGAGHVDTQYDNDTYLNVTVVSAPAVINSYDIQVASTGASRRNAMIDVNTEYMFVVNVTCPTTWQEIEYINITAWYDAGSEASTYNGTAGGNLNMFLQYQNTTGTAVYNKLWPDNEVTKGDLVETVYNESCHVIKLEFTPLNQVRSAVGDGGGWDNTTNATNDAGSWNFKIEATTSGGNTTWVKDEYGVYRYCEVSSSASVSASALPGHRASTSPGDFTITYKANTPYKLTVTTNVTLNRVGGGDSISRAYINVSGGDISGYDSLSDGIAYILGSSGSYHAQEIDDPQETINDVAYHCDIPYGTLSGTYSSKLYYTLSLDTT